jgi:hypothetical protein
MGIPKYVRDKATARHEVSRLRGVQLDMDEVPRGTVSENDARWLCNKYSMRFEENYRGAAALFKALERKLSRTPRRSRVKAAPPKPFVSDEVETIIRNEYGEEMMRMPFQTYVEFGARPEFTAEHVTRPKKDGKKEAYSQGMLF